MRIRFEPFSRMERADLGLEEHPATSKPAGRIPTNLGSRDYAISPAATDLFVITSIGPSIGTV